MFLLKLTESLYKFYILVKDDLPYIFIFLLFLIAGSVAYGRFIFITKDDDDKKNVACGQKKAPVRSSAYGENEKNV